MKYFSPEDLLEFQYDELSPEKRQELELTLKQNWSLRQKLEVMKEAGERLNKSMESPRKEAVNAILQYAVVHSRAAL